MLAFSMKTISSFRYFVACKQLNNHGGINISADENRGQAFYIYSIILWCQYILTVLFK